MPSVSNKKRKEFFKKINKLEKELEIKKLDSSLFNILNYFVVKDHYMIAILISRILGYVFSKPMLRNALRRVTM